MAVASMKAAVDLILGRFRTAWQAQTPPVPTVIYYDNPKDTPDGDENWVRVQLTHVDGREATLANDVGTRRFRRSGQLVMQIFVPAGEGLTDPYKFAKVVVDAFEGVRTGTDGIRYFNTRVNEIGVYQSWFQLDVITEFEYDEIK